MTNKEKLSKTFMQKCEDNIAAIFQAWPSPVPVKAQVNEFIPEICKLPYDYLFRDDPVAMAECTLLTQEYLELDAIHSNLDMYVFMPSNMGAKIRHYKDHMPDIDRSDYLIKGSDDLGKIKFRGIDSKLRYHIDYCKAWNKYVGVDFAPTFDSPWNLAASIYGLENLVVDALGNPEFVHELMRRVVCDFMAPYCDSLVSEVDVPYIIGADAWASLPIVSFDILKEFDRPYVEMLNKVSKMEIPFVSGGYWGIRYLDGSEREELMDYIIEVGGGTLYVYDPDPYLAGPEYFRAYADKKNVPLLFGMMNTMLENGTVQDAIEYTKNFVLAGKNGKTPFQINYSNIGPKLPIDKVKASILAARTYGHPGADANTKVELPESFESFEDFLKRKLADNPEGYKFDWLEKSGYSHLR